MRDKRQSVYHYFYSARLVLQIALLCTIVILLSSTGITDESVGIMADMPRYVMNGVYFYDLIGDLPINNPFEHAYRYFARYPALSLGHHPIFLGIAEIPFYMLFGISIFSARLTIVFFMLLAAIMWFLLVRSVYDEMIAFFSSLIFVTTPFVIQYSRIVMSEIPTLALIILSTYLFYQYCESDKRKYLAAFVFAVICSVYAKHSAVFMFPVFLLGFITKKGIKKLLSKEVIIACIMITILLLPLILITLKYAKVNLDAGIYSNTFKLMSGSPGIGASKMLYYIKAIWNDHLTLPVVLLSLIAIVVTIYRRDKRSLVFLFWIVACYLLMTYLRGFRKSRYTFYWIPVFSLFAATTIDFFQTRSWKVLISIVLILIVGYQFVVVFNTEPAYTSGYEEAAKYIVAHKKGESVLYSSVEDSGYFIFFVRKHNPKQDLIILRADKILATSEMYGVVEERITKPEEIYENLQKYGVGYVVIQDIQSDSQALEWLREEVKTEKFILEKKIMLRSSDRRLNNVSLGIYEYKDYIPPKEGVVLEMNIRLMGDWIKIPLKDLL